MKAMDVGQRPGSEIQQKNHVERAIIMAAGTGTRMRPVTLTTPKPLIRVKGVRMIDTVIQALHENGIYEIYVVVGYRKEQFACLTAEYKGLPAGYINVYLNCPAGPFANKNIPEIVDFGVLEKYRNKGIGTRLMDTAERLAQNLSGIVCLGVGLHAGYGCAQRMYIKRGYIPDGSGVWYRDRICTPYSQCCNDDDLILYLSKVLE